MKARTYVVLAFLLGFSQVCHPHGPPPHRHLEGVSLKTIAEMSGWKSVKLLVVYLRASGIAFSLAGAKCLIMSLWQVPATATAIGLGTTSITLIERIITILFCE